MFILFVKWAQYSVGGGTSTSDASQSAEPITNPPHRETMVAFGVIGEFGDLFTGSEQ